MSKNYICTVCGATYDDVNNPPPDTFVCELPTCDGGGLTGLIIEDQTTKPSNNNGGLTSSTIPTSGGLKEAGLCVLLMDASGSMGEPVFPEHSQFKSKYNDVSSFNPNGLMSKREMIANIAAQAIFDLKSISKTDTAYLCAVKYDHTQAVMFTKTVAEIIEEQGTPQSLAKYFYDELCSMGGGTDIDSALKMAHSFTQSFIADNMPGMGTYQHMMHSKYSDLLGYTIDVPNVRTLIYTDGEQFSGPIHSPFQGEPNLLMGAFVGQKTDNGYHALKSVLANCPFHGDQQFFVLDSPESIATLRGLFRMASGASGFCPTCIATAFGNQSDSPKTPLR